MGIPCHGTLRGSGGDISKEVFQLTDTYVIDVVQPSDALQVLMLCCH